MKETVKIVTTVKDSSLLPEGVSKQFKVKLKNREEDFLVCY